jgi:hypothetical protein
MLRSKVRAYTTSFDVEFDGRVQEEPEEQTGGRRQPLVPRRPVRLGNLASLKGEGVRLGCRPGCADWQINQGRSACAGWVASNRKTHACCGTVYTGRTAGCVYVRLARSESHGAIISQPSLSPGVLGLVCWRAGFDGLAASTTIQRGC